MEKRKRPRTGGRPPGARLCLYAGKELVLNTF